MAHLSSGPSDKPAPPPPVQKLAEAEPADRKSVDMVGWNPSLTSEPPSSASPKGGDTVPLRGGRSRGLSVGETDEPFLSVQGIKMERFQEIKALFELYEGGFMTKEQYDVSRDRFLAAPDDVSEFFSHAPDDFRALRDAEPATIEQLTSLEPVQGCMLLIEYICAALDIPWRTTVTATILLHRYSIVLARRFSFQESEAYLKALQIKHRAIIACACLLLGSKVEETLFSLRRLLVTLQKIAPSLYNDLVAGRQGGGPDVLSNSIRDREADILIRLGFDITVNHAHHYAPLLCRILETPHRGAINQKAYDVLDRCLVSSIWLSHRPQLIALAALYVGWKLTAEVESDFEWSTYNLTEVDVANVHDLVTILVGTLSDDEQETVYRDATDLPRPREDLEWNRPEYKPEQCRKVEVYEMIEVIDEGTYGTVWLAQEPEVEKKCALKQLKKTNARNGFPYYMLRELVYLKSLSHKNIIKGNEILVHLYKNVPLKSSTFYIQMEYVRYDLREIWFLQRDKKCNPWSPAHIKDIMRQLLEAIAYMHERGIMHRDIKLSNLLFSDDGELKVADLGSIREAGRTQLKLTTAVVTIWYRPPELLLGGEVYTSSIDVWSVGCVFMELLQMAPIFPGSTPDEMIARIIAVMGPPTGDIWDRCFSKLPEAAKFNGKLHTIQRARSLEVRLPTASVATLDLLHRLLNYDPDQRITARDALSHPYFQEEPTAQKFILKTTVPKGVSKK